MKILILTWACDGEDVSEPEIAYKWVKEISKDHTVTLFSVSRSDRFGCVEEQFSELNVIEWKDISSPRFLRTFVSMAKPGYLPYYFKARKFLRKLLKNEHFDVIHHISPFAWRYPSPASGLGVPLIRGPVGGGVNTPVGFKKAMRGNEPLFVKLRNIDTYRKKWDRIFKKSFAETEKFLFVAPYVEEVVSPLLVNSFAVETEQGLNETQFRPQKILRSKIDEKVRLLFVGRIIRTKGLLDTIRAIAKTVVIDNIELIVVGDGSNMDACRRETEKLGLGGTVFFLGRCDKEQLNSQYEQADIFVFPSFRETTGTVLLEAMSHSLPIITCANGGPDYIVDESCGIRIPPLSEDQFSTEIADAINLLVNDEDLRNRLSKQAWNKATKTLVWSAKRKRMTAIYEEVFKKGPLKHSPF